MLLDIVIVVAAVILALLIVIARQPADFRVTRSIAVGAPASVVFPHVNDLPLWAEWSPWAKMDPEAKVTYPGTRAGVGAVHEWTGPKTGAGRMTVVESRAPERVRFRLEFFKPFKATNAAEFTFTPQDGGTLITWTMTGKNDFMGKAFGLFVNCDKMIGGQFEQGLADLKVVTEAEAKI